jgi:hypothetical protein
MAWYNFGKKQESVVVGNEPLYSQFSTPFGKIGDANLSLPYVRSYGSERFIRFGIDNLFPQVVNQMYYQSALNGSIINFKANAVIGGGYELQSNDSSGIQKVKEYTFIKKNKFNKLIRQITKDIIMHGRVCLIIDPTAKDISIKRVGPERVRTNVTKTSYTISDDWARSVNMFDILPYYVGAKEKTLFVYEIDGDAGQDIYPIPQYCSALNDAFLDGEMSYLQKSNIINSIFPSFMIKLAKKFGSQDEINQFKDTINKAKGAPSAGRIMTFVANSADQLPTIETIPTNNNDKIFDSTLQRVDSNICRAHSIDPLLMGIRVSGSLGNGNELHQSYTIFEKNVIMPLREMVTEIADELLFIGGVNSTIIINNYQIIDDVIVDKTNPIK